LTTALAKLNRAVLYGNSIWQDFTLTALNVKELLLILKLRLP
jgi:hypothetical protein